MYICFTKDNPKLDIFLVKFHMLPVNTNCKSKFVIKVTKELVHDINFYDISVLYLLCRLVIQKNISI